MFFNDNFQTTDKQMITKKIILMGYMGSGKSTVAKQLSTETNIPFLDLDLFIEEQEKCSIEDIFQKKGEIYFRKKETQSLKLLLENNENQIIALGGGTPCFGKNIDLIKQYSTSFYLKLSPNELIKRLETEKSKRPVISHLKNEDLLEFIHKHLFERSPYYSQANYTITTDHISPAQIAQQIKAYLKLT